MPFMARLPPDESAISCDYSRSFCQPHLLQRPSGIVSWASRTIGISWTTSFSSPGSLSVESFFSGGLEWPSCVKEYLSLFQSQTSASYQTLWMWVAGPHRRTPRLGLLVSSSEDSLHQPERASSSSVRPEGLRTPVGGPVDSSVPCTDFSSDITSSNVTSSTSFSPMPFRPMIFLSNDILSNLKLIFCPYFIKSLL